jgi:hypothetical protein
MLGLYTATVCSTTCCVVCTLNGTPDYTFWTLYRSYFKGIGANIELPVYSATCCRHNKNTQFKYTCL